MLARLLFLPAVVRMYMRILRSNQIVFLTTRTMYVHIGGKLVLCIREEAVLAVKKCLLLVSSMAVQLSETFHDDLSHCQDDCRLFRRKYSHLLMPPRVLMFAVNVVPVVTCSVMYYLCDVLFNS